MSMHFQAVSTNVKDVCVFVPCLLRGSLGAEEHGVAPIRGSWVGGKMD